MQIRQEIFKRTDVQVLHYSRENSETFFYIRQTILPLAVAKLQYSPVVLHIAQMLEHVVPFCPASLLASYITL